MEEMTIKDWVIFQGITVDYIGQTECEIPNGWGKAQYLDGKCYEGEWKNGKMHGSGKEFYPGGNIEFEGEYKESLREGYGKAYLHDGKLIYEGEWIRGEQSGDSSSENNH